jgi:hypothetical protein
MRTKQKKPAARKAAEAPWWQVIRFKGTPAAQVGRVQAPDRQAAIKLAIEKYSITDPIKQSRLSAYRVS